MLIRAFLLCVVVAAVALVGQAAGWRAEFAAAASAAMLVNAWYAVRLVRHAVTVHSSSATGQCRSAGLLGLATAVVGATCAMSALVSMLGAKPLRIAHIVALGVGLAAAAYLPALLMLPGAAASTVARLRRALDGVSVGICLLFISWVLVIAPQGRIDSLGFYLAVISCCVVSLAVVTALRTGRARRSAIACAGGVALAIAGLGGLALALANDSSLALANDSSLARANESYAIWPSIFLSVLVAAPAITFAGARRISGEDHGPPELPGTFAGYPVLALPAVAGMAVALHRLITGRPFDRPSVLLGVLAIAVVALRETFGALDVARYARQVVAQEAQFRSLVAGSTDVIMVVDPDLVVRWQSPAAARQFGLSDQDVVGRHFLSMLQPEDAAIVGDRLADVLAAGEQGMPANGRPALVEARLRDGFGQWRDTESSITDQRDAPEVCGLVVHIRDVSERKEMERRLHRLAFADQLTGLANRRQLMLSVVALRSVPGGRGALLLLELEGFTAVNDVRGYDVGDAVLVEVARRLREGVRGSDLPARLSGDEFAVVTESSPVQAYALASRLLTMLAEPIVLPGVTVHLTASVGMADLAGGPTGDAVLRRADLALRRAKQLGRGRIEWYDEAIEKALLRRMTLEQELPDALLGGQLDLIYQPILDLVAQRPLAVEALLRWRHPRLGTLLPVDIIPVAEDLGLIEEIGSWVLRQACRQLADWRGEGRDLSMAVNVSARQLDGAGMTVDVAATLDLHDLPPERLVLEIAEGGLDDDTGHVCEQLSALRTLGVRTALDDFGAGPDSLSHLRRLPLDMVKVGRSIFDETAGRSGPPLPIIDVMVGLGRRLGLEIVAQGLEAPDHLDVVRGAGCRLGQGHLFARPQPAEHIEAYLDGFPARSV